MAKLTRAVQKVFADSAGANEMEQIGSLRNGSAVYTKDPVVLQALSQYLGGLLDCVSSDKYIPPLEDINAIYFLITRQLAYLFQEGIPEYDAATTYYQNSIVKNSGTTDLYYSKTNDNVGNALSDTVNWGAYQGAGKYMVYNSTLNSIDFVTAGGTVKARLNLDNGNLDLAGTINEGVTF